MNVYHRREQVGLPVIVLTALASVIVIGVALCAVLVAWIRQRRETNRERYARSTKGISTAFGGSRRFAKD